MPSVSEMAWTAIKYGSSLSAEAKRFGVHPGVLDRAIWFWRGRRTQSHSVQPLVEHRTVERLAS
jgi:hypothetical protein